MNSLIRTLALLATLAITTGRVGGSAQKNEAEVSAGSSLSGVKRLDPLRPDDHEADQLLVTLTFYSAPLFANAACREAKRQHLSGAKIVLSDETVGVKRYTLDDSGEIALWMTPGSYALAVPGLEIYDEDDLEKSEKGSAEEGVYHPAPKATGFTLDRRYGEYFFKTFYDSTFAGTVLPSADACEWQAPTA